MERKSCCSSMKYGFQTTVVTPKIEDVKPEVPKKEDAEPAKGTCGTGMTKSPKIEEKLSVPVKKEESVKVNVGSGCCGFK
ncbi:hypothetical protein PVL29_017925 [Vitis rotundifolia]|uniref:Uncharacterized protein n=1 Tax=Vitis rotundifolia TaxID=103349 RepID=A0AA38Z3L8_VITRO|nr:hypothetical protein PVL29_017925 [Vitis rotundifolia]